MTPDEPTAKGPLAAWVASLPLATLESNLADSIAQAFALGQCEWDEHSLTRAWQARLREQGCEALDGELAGFASLLQLYGRHFVLQHLLQRLRPVWLAQGWILTIDLMRLSWRPLARDPAASCDQMPQLLDYRAHYYASLAPLCEVHEATVMDLIAQFGQRLAAWPARAADLASLGLSASATPAQITQAYRRARQRLHPDKGGDAQAFTALQAAYDRLSAGFSEQRA
jgi:hypothetical protein